MSSLPAAKFYLCLSKIMPAPLKTFILPSVAVTGSNRFRSLLKISLVRLYFELLALNASETIRPSTKSHLQII